MSRVLALLGPTAAGKSELAVRLAEEVGAHILSVDSMQVYRRMDIGTAKPGSADQARVPHHMIDLVDPGERHSVAQFQSEGRRILEELRAADRPVLITGGSGLHFRSLVDPLEFPPHDPALRQEIEARGADGVRARLLEIDPHAGDVVDLANPRRVQRALEIFELTGQAPSIRAAQPQAQAVADYRPDIAFRAVGIDPGPALALRVEQRMSSMLAAGLLDEVAGLAGHLGPTAGEAVGYKQLLPVIGGERSKQEGVEDARRATMGLAKRQRTYFRRDPRIQWVPWSSEPPARYEQVRRLLLEEP